MGKRWLLWGILVAGWWSLIVNTGSVGARVQTSITRLSMASDGTQANSTSRATAVSTDGRYVAFESIASNLVPEDNNGRSDIFVHDRLTGQTVRLSVATGAVESNGDSHAPALSDDGRYVAFESLASNLVSEDTNGMRDIFVHDRGTGQTTRVSVASAGTPGNEASESADISGDGRFVAFASLASNLVDGDSNLQGDIFLHDRQSGETRRVSVASSGAQSNGLSSSPAISRDGTSIAFESTASNLSSANSNTLSKIFVHDVVTGQTRDATLSVGFGQSSDGPAYNPSISGDGRFVAFDSSATNLVLDDSNGTSDVFLHDQGTRVTVRLSLTQEGSEGNNASYRPRLSDDGNYVAFVSLASNLVPGDTNALNDVFLQEIALRQTRRGSVAADGAQSNNASDRPDLFLTQSLVYVVFESDASNLVTGDTNSATDIFISAARPPGTTLYLPVARR